MAKWSVSLLVLAGLLAPLQAAGTVRSENFIVEAPTKEMAEEFARLAEQYRKEKAKQWLGKEMPTWKTPCPLQIIPDHSGAQGATTFNFELGTQKMFIQGPIDRMKASVLPHEITHTVFAYHFRQPVPRWADEGGSVYSEDDLERKRHDKMSVQYLNAGRAFTLKALFHMRDYPASPGEQMILYAEGYSISKYLIEQSDRATFLNFVSDGMRTGWDQACQKHFEIKSVNALEVQWLEYLRQNARGDVVNNPRRGVAEATFASKETKPTIRQSGSQVQPQLDPLPVARGSSPSSERKVEGNRSWDDSPQRFFESATAQFPPAEECREGNCPAPGRKSPSPVLPPPAMLLPPEPPAQR